MKRKYFRFYLNFLVAGLTVLSCNSEKKKMINGLVGIYAIDTINCDYRKASSFLSKKIRLVLSKDCSYYFIPRTPVLIEYEGNWDLSDDWEISNYIFYCKNGERQENATMYFIIKKGNSEYKICFGDKIK